MSADASSPQKPAPFLTMPKLLGLLALTIVATGAVVYFALRPKGGANEAVVSVLDDRAASEVKVNTGEVLDATVANSFAPELGHRYKVRIQSESRDGASMITRIGRTLTFVDGVKPGDIVVVEVTRVSPTTAQAVLIEHISSGPAPTSAPPAARAASRAPSQMEVPPGEIYTGTVVSVGKFGDGLVKRGQQQIYVPGVQKGDRVVYEITEKRANAWTARLVELLGAATAGDDSGRASRSREARQQDNRRDQAQREFRAPEIKTGNEYTVTVTEKERRHPDTDGVARLEGLAVLIPGTQPGDRVKIRITERRATLAMAEVLEKLPVAASPQPTALPSF